MNRATQFTDAAEIDTKYFMVDVASPVYLTIYYNDDYIDDPEFIRQYTRLFNIIRDAATYSIPSLFDEVNNSFYWDFIFYDFTIHFEKPNIAPQVLLQSYIAGAASGEAIATGIADYLRTARLSAPTVRFVECSDTCGVIVRIPEADRMVITVFNPQDSLDGVTRILLTPSFLKSDIQLLSRAIKDRLAASAEKTHDKCE